MYRAIIIEETDFHGRISQTINKVCIAVNKSNEFVINLQQVCECQVATSLILTDLLQVVLSDFGTCQDLISSLYVCMAIKHIIVLFVETPRKFITAKLLIRKPGSSSVRRRRRPSA